MMEKLLQLLGSRNAEDVIVYIKEHPAVLNEKDKSGASGFMQILYHRIPEAIEIARTIKKTFTYTESIAIGKEEEVVTAVEDNEELVSAFLDDGFTPIGLATFFGKTKIAQYLFEQGADPSICADNPMKVNAMHAAAAIGSYDLMELYVSNGYDANIPQMNNITPVQSAAYRGDLEMVKLLVRHGADPKIASVDGIDALGYAKEGGHEEILFYLKTLKKEDK